jgi:GT2 family glycosyltransferase
VKASFIIPLYNGLPLTQAMLDSLRATVPAGLAHEIILVDDGSSDGTREWLKTPAISGRVLLNERNLGFAATCNRGAAVAAGEFLFFLNNDLVMLPGWLEPMLAAFGRFPRAGLVGNVQRNFATGAVDHAGVFFDHKGKPTHLTRRGWAAWRETVAVTGACFGIRRATWQKLGGFDEAYVNGGEDVDLALRAIEAGFTNHVALRSVVRHHVSASAGRKLRDEHNTARLHQRWREFILPRIVRRCSLACLQASWEEPRNYPDRSLVLAALMHFAGLIPVPSAGLVAAARASLELERNRWAHLLEGAPLRPVREIAWQFFPAIPEDPPVV